MHDEKFNIRRPLLVRGHQAARRIVPVTVSKSLKSFQSLVDSRVFHSVPVLQSAIVNLPICYQLLASQQSGVKLLLGQGMSKTLPTGCLPSAWVPPGYPLKIIKFQACPQDPQKSEKVSQRSPKVTKKAPKTIPGTPI